MALAVLVTALVLVVEVAGGLMSGSLALLSDAGHVFSDVLALLLSWYGVRQSGQPANAKMTYGYHRVGIFVALVNAATLVGVSLAVVAEAYRRLQQPEPIEGDLMMGVAVFGLLVNLLVLVVLQGHAHNLAVRSAVMHVAGDLLGSVAVIASGAVILATGWTWADPLASVLIAVIITVGSLRIVREAVNVLLESAPVGVNMDDVTAAMSRVSGVRAVHDVHIWSISPELRALSSHVLVEDTAISQAEPVLEALNHMLQDRFRIRHTTLQLEVEGLDPNAHYCTLSPEGMPEPHPHNHDAHAHAH